MDGADMVLLLGIDDLPPRFDYPQEFTRVVELGLTDLEPWRILDGEALRDRHRGLRKRYPSRVLVPFARRIDNDDVACWDVDQGGRVVVVHDFASPGWEHEADVGGFYDWLRRAVEDLIEYD